MSINSKTRRDKKAKGSSKKFNTPSLGINLEALGLPPTATKTEARKAMGQVAQEMRRQGKGFGDFLNAIAVDDDVTKAAYVEREEYERTRSLH
jgi:hypothetical protein